MCELRVWTALNFAKATVLSQFLLIYEATSVFLLWLLPTYKSRLILQLDLENTLLLLEPAGSCNHNTVPTRKNFADTVFAGCRN